MHNIFSIQGKRVLLTGASGGIGSALLNGFLENGALVAAVDLTASPEHYSGKYQHEYCFLACDMSNAEAVAQLPSNAEKALGGPLDVIVHAAWACPDTDAYGLERLRAVAAVGLEAAYMLYGIVAPQMAKRGEGSLISIASMNGINAFPENPAYTSMKAALRLFTKTVARDFGEYGVRANNLCPGYVHTAMTAKSFSDPVLNEKRRERTMLGRWATPEDMVGPCLFLASDASRYITGIDLMVDGGWTAKGL